MRTSRYAFLVIAFAQHSLAQAPPSFEDQLSELWNQKKYDELEILLDQKSNMTPPDIVALYCSKFLYVFIKPDKAKALEALTKLKQLAQATTNTTFKGFVDEEIAGVQGIPDGEFLPPTSEIMDGLHAEFSDEYPLLTFAAGLRRFE